MAQGLKPMPGGTPLQLGWINYWNLLPLKRELERSCGDEIEFHRGHPSVVNRWLAEGKVALAPSSSVCLLKNAANEVALPLGIAATGSVNSVYLGLHHEEAGLLEVIRARQNALRDIVRQALMRYPGDARSQATAIYKGAQSLPQLDPGIAPPLTVTPASAASTALARVLYRLWFGETAYQQRAAETGNAAANAALSLRRPMELLIGDEALIRRATFRVVIDLGEAWRELTDLPFVFAVWQSRKPLAPYWRQKIFEAAELAQARMRIEPTYYSSELSAADVHGHTIDLGAYWKGIQYRLSPAHFRGLALYLALVRGCAPEAYDDKAVMCITRWENFAQTSPLGSLANP